MTGFQLNINGTTLLIPGEIDKIKGESVKSWLTEWYNNEDYVIVNTSGSTGQPKPIHLKKTLIEESAKRTVEFFNLNKSSHLLNCLPCEFVAGKLMFIRALLANCMITHEKPTSNPASYLNQAFDFTALTPAMMHKVLETDWNQIKNVKHIILGGAPVSHTMERKIIPLHNSVYATYGMTETATHIALRKLGGTEYKALKGITLWQDEDETLIIQGFGKQPIHTTDIVDLIDTKTFVWLGRKDNVINSGGVKIFPEQLENDISALLDRPFYIISTSDTVYGECPAIVLEGNKLDPQTERLLLSTLKDEIGLRAPKRVFYQKSFGYTETGKIKRTIP